MMSLDCLLEENTQLFKHYFRYDIITILESFISLSLEIISESNLFPTKQPIRPEFLK